MRVALDAILEHLLRLAFLRGYRAALTSREAWWAHESEARLEAEKYARRAAANARRRT